MNIQDSNFDDINPATESVIASVAECNNINIDIVVKTARKSFESSVWSKQFPSRRKQVLLRLAQLIRDRMRRTYSTRVLQYGQTNHGCLQAGYAVCR